MAFPDSHNVRLIKRQFRFISPALLVDWIVVALLGLLSHYIERQWPYERPVELYLNNPDYQYAIMKEQVPSGPGSKMEIYTWYIPLTGIVLVAAARKSFHDIHHGILGLCASLAIMRLTVEFVSLSPKFSFFSFSRFEADLSISRAQSSSRIKLED